MRPAIKDSGFKYWEYILCYVDDVLVISHKPMRTMDGIKSKFKLKGDKTEQPDYYLGADLSLMDNVDGDQCWSMSSDKYCIALIKTVESTLE